MSLRAGSRALPGLILGLAVAPLGAQEVEPHGGMLRYPDVSAQHIVFSYADDLWLVPREGGQAVPLASPRGPETFPRFAPDGSALPTVWLVHGYGNGMHLPADAAKLTALPYPVFAPDFTRASTPVTAS